ncbi:MAG: 50S ribosomal protein P1 [Candidatus Bathyarchaeia archaeon]
MEYIYAALLLYHSGQKIDEENLRKVLNAASLTPDEARLKSLVAALSEVDIGEVIKSAGVSISTPTQVATAAGRAESKAAEAKEEKEEKEEEKEEALEGLAALFG